MSIVEEIYQAVADGVPRDVIRRKVVQYVRDRLHDFDFPIIVTRGPYVVTITSANIVNRVGLVLTLFVSKNGNPVPPFEPVIFPKPPLLVADPAGPIQRSYIDKNGNTVIVNFRLDPVQAVKNELANIITSLS